MIDLICLRQSFERKDIAEIKWINGNSNLADAMTKSKPYTALQALINSNWLQLNIEAWVERTSSLSTTAAAKSVSFASLISTAILE